MVTKTKENTKDSKEEGAYNSQSLIQIIVHM
jgi:hypothetical protein